MIRTDAIFRAISTGRTSQQIGGSALTLSPLSIGGYRLISALGQGGALPFYVGVACLNLDSVRKYEIILDRDTANILTDEEITAIQAWGEAELRFLRAWQSAPGQVTLRCNTRSEDPWKIPVYNVLESVETENDLKEELEEMGVIPI